MMSSSDDFDSELLKAKKRQLEEIKQQLPDRPAPCVIDKEKIKKDVAEQFRKPVMAILANSPTAESAIEAIVARRHTSASPFSAKRFPTATRSTQEVDVQTSDSWLKEQSQRNSPIVVNDEIRLDQAQESPSESEPVIATPTRAPSQEADVIMHSDAALHFAKNSVRLLEKALQTDRVLKIQKELRALDIDEADIVTTSFELSRVPFECAKYTAHRPVVDIASIPQSTSFYVAYGSSRLGGPKSLILKWSFDSETKPEEVFFCDSAELTCITLLPADPTIVFGGTSGGNLIMWQLKSGSRPVQFIHSCMKGVLAIFAYNDSKVVTLSDECEVTIWAVGASLAEGKRYNLRGKQSKIQNSNFLMAAASEDENSFIASSFDGLLWKSVLRPGDENALATDMCNSSDLCPALPYTHLTLQKRTAQSRPPIVVASSMYWTMTLWLSSRGRGIDSGATTASSNPASPKALFCFEHQKATTHTTHVDWSPIHKHVFVNCTRDGQLSLWDLNQSWSSPILSVDLGEELLRVAFSSDGRRIIVGSASGKVTVGAVPNIANTADLSFFENTLIKYS